MFGYVLMGVTLAMFVGWAISVWREAKGANKALRELTRVVPRIDRHAVSTCAWFNATVAGGRNLVGVVFITRASGEDRLSLVINAVGIFPNPGDCKVPYREVLPRYEWVKDLPVTVVQLPILAKHLDQIGAFVKDQVPGLNCPTFLELT